MRKGNIVRRVCASGRRCVAVFSRVLWAVVVLVSCDEGFITVLWRCGIAGVLSGQRFIAYC